MNKQTELEAMLGKQWSCLRYHEKCYECDGWCDDENIAVPYLRTLTREVLADLTAERDAWEMGASDQALEAKHQSDLVADRDTTIARLTAELEQARAGIQSTFEEGYRMGHNDGVDAASWDTLTSSRGNRGADAAWDDYRDNLAADAALAATDGEADDV